MPLHNRKSAKGSRRKKCVRVGRAFLGHESQCDSVRYSFEGGQLVCSLSYRYKALLLIACLLGGPGLILYFVSQPDLFWELPLYFRVAIPCFIAFISYACLHLSICHPRVRFAFGFKQIIFSTRDFFGRYCEHVVQMDQATGLRIGEEKRTRSSTGRRDNPANLITCYYLLLIIRDSSDIRVLETTNKDLVLEIAAIVKEQTRGAIALGP